jgi:eukaryotic-like serine/threonine-protein kinase
LATIPDEADTESSLDDTAARILAPGECVGRYTVRSFLGEGASGQVFAASDPELGRQVALKLVAPGPLGASSRRRARFLREAQALAALRHPNVVTVYDAGTHGDALFVAMELVEGITLGEWMRTPRPWREVRDVFLAAGRGLAAAHAAGLVHRDFKPHNVLVGGGRVVVLDFGLARAEDGDGDGDDGEAEAQGPAPPATMLAAPLTMTGERLGTPRYMAPEQHAAGRVTARSDQFAFCVALYEALYQRSPFVGGTITELRAAVERGLRAPAPPGARVPRFLAAAVARGLRADPAARHASMNDLLAELARDPGRTARRWGLAVLGAAAVAAAGYLAAARTRAAAPPPCLGAEAQIAPLWDDAARDKVREAFRHTGRPYADDSFARVDAALRGRLAAWARAHRDSCEATHVRHEQSEALLDLRTRCLLRSKAELGGLVALLEQADAATVDRSTRAVATVGDVAGCSDPAVLGAAIAPPPPAVAAQADALREEIARLWPLFELNKLKEGLAAGRDVVARARALGYAPLLARALLASGRFEVNAGDVPVGIDALYQAAHLGTEVGDTDVVAAALPLLEFALGWRQNRPEAADVVQRWAAAAVARAGSTPIRLVELFGRRASALNKRGDHFGALALLQLALGLEALRSGPESLGVAMAMHSIADEMEALGHGRDAEPLYQRALPMLEKIVGPDHYLMGIMLEWYGWNRLSARDHAAAVVALERALGIYERVLGPDDILVAAPCYGLGIAHLGERRLPEARAFLERAVRIHQAKLGPDDPHLASDYDVLADLSGVEGKLEAAHEFAAKALAIRLKALGRDHETTAISYRIDANYLLRLGRRDEARAAIDQALAITKATKGETHPYYAAALLIRGDVLAADGRPAEAISAYQQAVGILERSMGRDFPGLCPPLLQLSAAQLRRGDARGALEAAERAVAVAPAGRGEREVAEFRLAQARWALGQDRPAALALARKARAGLAALAFPSEELPLIDRWLASR